MAEKLIEMTCAAFTLELASPTPTPGGGSASALLLTLSASLCAMAAQLSLKRAQEPVALTEAAIQAEALRRRSLALIDMDAEAFLPLYRAYALPKDAPDRAETLLRLSLRASEAPLALLRLCADVTVLLEQLLYSAGSSLLSDVGCAAAVCRAAADCAAMNVWVNTRSFPNDPQVLEYEREAKKLQSELARRADAVTQAVMESLVN